MQRAVYLEKLISSPDELKIVSIPKPTVKKGYAIVKIKVAASNPADRLAFLDIPLPGWSLPIVPGLDLCGVVEEIGEDVSNVKVGDVVFTCNGTSGPSDPEPHVAGAYQEYLCVAAYKLSIKPAALSCEVAAALGCVGTTAYGTVVEVGKIRAGSRLLVLGGSSAVGTVAIQLAKHLGAQVTTTASSRALDYVNSLDAADKIILYNETKWEEDESLRDIDMILDCVGDEHALERATAKGVLKSDGIFVTVANFSVGFNPAGHPPLTYAAFYRGTQSTAAQDFIADLIARDVIRLPIENRFPFTTEGAQEMYKKMLTMKSLGKNVLLISE